jgi:hypothetical protein
MLKRLAIFGAWALLCPGIMASQPNQTPGGKGQDARQGQPAVVQSNSHDKQNPGDQNQPKAGSGAPAGNAAFKWPAWMGDSNWWLVVVAGITGGFIAWQAWETRKAARGAQGAAEASLAQIELMKIKERARLRIEFFPPDFLFKREMDGYEVRFTVFNDGPTRAYILDDSLVAYIAAKPRKTSGWLGLQIPRDFLPEHSPLESQIAIVTEKSVFDNETDSAKISAAKANGLILHVNGRIWYRDIFEEEWMLEIDRYWDSQVRSWGPVGSGRHDSHRKVDTSYRDKAPKPD